MKGVKIFSANCAVCGKKYDGKTVLCYDCINEISKYSYGEKCEKCGRTLTNSNETVCEYCRKIKPQFDRASAVFPYKNDFKSAIRMLKFKNDFYRFKGMAQLIYENTCAMNVDADCIIYVPSDIKAFFMRNYCLSQELALYISKKMKIPVYSGFLIKNSRAKRQSTVNFEDRYKNIRNGFFKNPFYRKSVKGRKILLVDDVITTGSTVSECASLLKALGAESVYVTALTYGASK